MRVSFLHLIIILLISSIYVFPQEPDSVSYTYYQKGLEALAKSDTAKAELSFKNSIRFEETAQTQFELAKILINKRTIRGRAEARKLLTSAIYKDPENIEYRLLKAALMEYFSPGMAFKEYQDILEIDSTNDIALFQLGRIKEDDFNEFHHSVFQEDPFSPMLSLDKFALEDFEEAEQFFLKVLYHDSTNSQAILHLSTLYEDVGKPDKAIPHLQRLVELNPHDQQAHLYLGLMYYRTSNLKGAYEQYKNALILMKPAEQRDFTYYSVKELIKPLLGDEIKGFSEIDIKNLIDLYWRIKDPLYLTDYNERLLEHYSRVAYANLRFGVNRADLSGWKSDRGEVYLRYGEPLNRIRFRPQINAGGRTSVKLKTDVWYYNDMVFGFTDTFFNGKYQFSQPSPGNIYQSQYENDSYTYFNYVKKIRNETYDPKFEGPKFDVPYSVAQFKNANDNYRTDLYLSYGLKAADSLISGNNFVYHHKVGLFVLDPLFNKISEVIDTFSVFPKYRELKINDTTDYIINTVETVANQDSLNFGFEVTRFADKGVSSHHFPIDIKKFKKTNLDISDIVLASDIQKDGEKDYPLRRGKISILPNPTALFTESGKMFIYYELYNLRLHTGAGEFQQTLTIKKTEEKSGIFNSVLNIFGMGSDDKEIVLTTTYKVAESNPRIYFQLDMSKYEPGEYSLSLDINDHNSEEKTKAHIIFDWQ